MSTRTHPFRREELIACAKREAALRRSVYPRLISTGKMTGVEATREIDAMDAIVRVLEEYPLGAFAEEAVRLVCADLLARAGFLELIEKIDPDDWRKIKEHMVEVVKRAVVYTDPFPQPQAEPELDFA
jgi:hypothetical protein